MLTIIKETNKKRNITKSNELVLKIHNEIDTAQDRLLQEAEATIQNMSISGECDIELKAERLRKIGFTASEIVQKADEISEDRINKRILLAKTREGAKLIKHYKDIYPYLKFITEDELDRICDKYNLIHAPVSAYTKDVPDKNLIEIENAQELKSHDKCEASKYIKISEYHDGCPRAIRKIFDKNQIMSNNISLKDDDLLFLARENGYNGSYSDVVAFGSDINLVTVDKTGLFICAPENHFDLSKLTNKGKHGFFTLFEETVVQKDPIVFRYVKGGIQILSKWGLEAEEETLVVPTLN
jgi:hypothetical protein